MRKGVQIFNLFFPAVKFSGKTFTLFDVKVMCHASLNLRRTGSKAQPQAQSMQHEMSTRHGQHACLCQFGALVVC